ncbi:hydrogenase maturation nickel metallochaperone HypA [Candidatus Bipolaricaulota bacterium]|nr:hydrogenase maturation nickel metallochaperone HypA [Candidatus Bipolaricaulota bacterium]
MHEYAVVSELIAGLLPQLEPHPGRVEVVYLKKGEMRVLSEWAVKSAFEILTKGTRLEGARLEIEPVEWAVKSAFEILTKGTRLEGARLEIEPVEARIRCPRCGYTGKPDYLDDPEFHFIVPVITCPQCGAEVEVVSGRELYIDRVTVESPAPTQNGA